MTIIGHMIITWSSWSIHELFMNCSCTIFLNCSWTNHELVVHELFMNYSSWIVHELTSSWTQTYELQVHEPHQLRVHTGQGKQGKWKVSGKCQGTFLFPICQGNVRELFFKMALSVIFGQLSIICQITLRFTLRGSKFKKISPDPQLVCTRFARNSLCS